MNIINLVFAIGWILGLILGFGVRYVYYVITGKDIPMFKEGKE